MADGRIFKKRNNDDPNDGNSSDFASIANQLPDPKIAANSVREAREAARVDMERRIREKRAKDQEHERVCRCW
jgi:hypothetical protein